MTTTAEDIIGQGKDLSDKLKGIDNLIGQFIAKNNAHAIDWGNMTTQSHPDIVGEDGLLKGFNFTPAELSNFIGTMAAVKAITSDSGHNGNIQKLAKTIV